MWSPLYAAPRAQRVYLPQARTKPKSGLRMEIDIRWVDANGYRPVRVTAMPIGGPAAADREIRVELTPRSWAMRGAMPTTSRYLEIPEGSTRVETSIAVPQCDNWQMLEVSVFEGGRKLEDLSAPLGNVGYASATNEWTEAAPAILIIDRDTPLSKQRENAVNLFHSTGQLPTGETASFELPDIRSLKLLIPSPHDMPGTVNSGPAAGVRFPNRISDLETLVSLDDLPRLEVLPFAELPETWLEYTCFDVIMIGLADFQRLSEAEPRRAEAIRDWAGAGATLIVYGAGDDFAGLADLELLLNLSPMPGREQAPHLGWHVPDATRRTANLISVSRQGAWTVQNGQRVWIGLGSAAGDGEVPPGAVSRPAASGNTVPFVWRDLDMGQLVAIAADDPFPGEPSDWGWIFNCLGPQRWKWFMRHGLSLRRDNQDYWNWLIPGVGMPPVGTFLVLISLFVLTIGPLNYLVLRRRGRLYLLLVTVPGGAVLVTLGLFTYALVTDGLGVQVRIRSFTELDQRTGRSVSWSRQCYFAAIAPSEGLVFPQDTAIYPLEEEPAVWNGESASRRRVTWEDGQQYLTAGYLGSRALEQFLVVRACASRANLSVAEASDGNDPPRVSNGLGTRIEQLLLCDSAGRHFWAEGVEAGGSRALKPTELATARRDLAATCLANEPANPQGFNPAKHRYALAYSRSFYMYVDGDQAAPDTFTSLLEENLRRLRSQNLSLRPRSYIAVVASSPDVPLGVRAAREAAGFHVIRGRW